MALNRQPFVAEMYSLNNNGPVSASIRSIKKPLKPAKHEVFHRLMHL